MVRIKNIETDNNAKDIKNVLSDSDDLCWFSNGAATPYILLEIQDFVRNIHVEFQKGFQPKVVRVEHADTKVVLTKQDSAAVIEINGNVESIRLILDTSFDPYGRFCIYKITAE